MDKFSVNVKLNEDDVVEFQKAHYKRRVKPGMRYAIIGIIAVLFIMNVILDISSGSYFSITAALLGIILVVLLGTPLMFRMTAKKGLKNNKMLMAEYEYTFTKDFITSVSEHGTTDSNWETMYELLELKDHLLFYIGNNQAFIVPKRNFDDPSQIDVIREWAKGIPEPKKPFNLLLITMGVTLAIIIILFIIIVLIEVL